MPLPDVIASVDYIELIIIVILVIGVLYQIIYKKKGIVNTLWRTSLIPQKGKRSFWRNQILLLSLLICWMIFLFTQVIGKHELSDVPRYKWSIVSIGASSAFFLFAAYEKQQSKELKGRTGSMLRLTSKIGYLVGIMLIIGGVMLLDTTINSNIVFYWYILIVLILLVGAGLNWITGWGMKYRQVQRAWGK